MSQPLRAVDLFAGAGGMTLGLRRAGFDVIGAVEIDPLAAETYQLNHRGMILLTEDIRSVDAKAFAKRVLGRAKQLDLLAACPPCQGFSSVSTLRCTTSVDDTRNRLIGHVLRFVDALRPRAILFENVPGLVNDWRFRDFIRGLRARKYYVDYQIEDAADYGVPQRRRRLLLVAALGKQVRVASKRKAVHATVRKTFNGLPAVGESGDPLHDYTERRAPSIRRFIASIPRDGGSRTDLPRSRQLDCHRRVNGFYDVYGRMSWDDVAPTITGGCINPSKGRFLHPEENRAVTLREAALLQSFPRSYKFSMRRGRYAVAEMIGNALPPRVVHQQALELRRQVFR